MESYRDGIHQNVYRISSSILLWGVLGLPKGLYKGLRNRGGEKEEDPKTHLKHTKNTPKNVPRAYQTTPY